MEISETIFQEIWKTILNEFLDVPDLGTMTLFKVRLGIGEVLGGISTHRAKSKFAIREVLRVVASLRRNATIKMAVRIRIIVAAGALSMKKLT